ncbi:DUF4082 domain-containing protein [Segetibacter koreensis]|uniref:DUF4082 domain-containing protein n=1 Tax=Segetibacter koreensis TaxID=398037 RepID=UPI000379C233|nr:DUF4082 domain-containing protein [Segetibacter koreensis]
MQQIIQKASRRLVGNCSRTDLRKLCYLSFVKSKKKLQFSLPLKYLSFLPLLVLLLSTISVTAQNAIVTENKLTGNPASEWDISGAGDLSIQGFATDISVNKGQTVRFKIKTNASAYTINIYRLGYYQGNGARKVGTGIITAALPQTQPADLVNTTTGLIDCGNWAESAHWDVPTTVVSGIYIAKLTRTDNGGASHIVFIVRDDASTSYIYFKTADATWQAYNAYGGNSLYVGNTTFPNGHAAKVSYNRPFYTRNGGGGGGVAEDWLFNAEYPMVRWMERNGYDMTYTTDVDADRHGDLITKHKVFLAVGHDEYWSGQQRSYVEAARDAGIHLAFFDGNEVYWKTRWEPSTDGSNTSYRTLVCYKEGTLGENVCGGKCDPMSNVWTGLWRDGCSFASADGCRPENALTGQISWNEISGAITVPATYKGYRFWRNTSIATLAAGQTATLANGSLGYEIDYEQNNGSYPAGRVVMSQTAINGITHKLSLYRANSGALVFGAGTMQWSWGLDGTHDRGTSTPDVRMQQATVNLFADMGAQPGSLQTGLVAATATSDLQAPVTVISSPKNGATISPNVAVTISGTATETAGVVAAVEISLDGGTTWVAANGTTNWSYSWTPTANGTYTIKSRAVDDMGNLEKTTTSSNTIQVSTNASNCTPPTATLAAAPANCQGNSIALKLSAATGVAPYSIVVNNQNYSNVTIGQNFATVSTEQSIWGASGTPQNPNDNDGQSIEIGVKFRASQSGTITGIRFYKGSGNTGTHTGNLWSSAGTKLASATFSSETASGWQEVRFTTPVTITANTTYVASYFSTSGVYASTDNFFATSSVTSGSLTALQAGVDGSNGVYKLGTSGFPSQSYSSSNYWVDVLFKPGGSYTFNLTSITDANGCNNTGNISSATVTQSQLQSGSITFYEDYDKDGYGNSAVTVSGCTAPAGYVAQGGDCKDSVASIHPGATEICGNNIDDNCDGRIDEGCTTTTTYYRDADGDLYGNASVTTTGTTPPVGYVSNNTDCNDNDASIYPGAAEVCDGKDNNCNGAVDEGCNVSTDGPGGPVLIISTSSNPFSRYFTEILKAQGLNEFIAKDISQVTATDLNNYDVVILGEMALSAANVTMLTNWVNAGGTLIAMRPDAQLATLLGITPVSGTLTDKYLLVNTSTEQGRGIVAQTIQFHGPANLYTLNGATSLATLYSSATAATTNPAVTIRDVGTNGGQAVAFAYDLARSIVYTRQGNPAWAGQERDGQLGGVDIVKRSNDLYFGNASFDPQPDWVDLNKVAIPQADEQQHLLTNIIIKGNEDKKPLPRFWFLPKGLKATIVMTGDDHGNGGTAGRFDQYKALSISNTADAVKNWTAIRSSSYIYPGTPITDAQAKSYQTDSFDISLHLNTNCADWTATSLPNFYTNQLQQFTNQLPSIAAPTTHRVHCLVWSDWASEPKVELNNKIRLNATYYYWPGEWLQNRSGMFTGSGMPMRFADINGAIIDNYQLTTQMTDESEQVYPEFVDSLLNKATGAEGYYGVFCANMHTDNVASTGSDAIINSAANHNIPVVSAKQMLTWLDGRNASKFSSLTWNNNALSFSVTAASGTDNLEAMLPMEIKTSRLTTITANGAAVSYRTETVKGIQYAFFPATTANYVANYNGTACTKPTAILNAAPADCQGKSIALKLTNATGVPPYIVVVNNQTYSNVIVGQNFATVSTEQSIWGTSGTPQNANLNDGQAIEVGVKFRASQSGNITGIRFYKGTNNTGTHTGNLWTSTGTKLASATFTAESASGWQEVHFATPVAISANTTYVASYLSNSGGYALTANFFGTSVTNGSLTALAAGVDGPNGVFIYGGGFPTSTYNSGNYWVDVLFTPSSSYTFNLTSITDANGCNNTGSISTATVTQSQLQSASQTFYQDNDADGYGNSAVTISACTPPAGYVARGGDCNDNIANINPGATEVCGNGIDDNCDGRIDEGCTLFYKDADNDGYGNPSISITANTAPVGYVSNNTDCNDNLSSVNPAAAEICGNGIDDNCNGTIDEGCPVATEQSVWGNTGSPVSPNDYDGRTIEVGVKFRASQTGTITGIRFYKGINNTGTHTGNLWTSTGTKLASATFVNETASGWQEVRFTTPVTISANTTYVASYFSSSGRYASTEGFFTSKGVTNGSLTALQAGVSGANGVYKYGTTGFPTSSYNSTNYWVDVLFKPTTAAKSTIAAQQADQKLTVKVMPNPTASYFTLLTAGAYKGLIQVRVIDAVGKVVETKGGVKAGNSLTIGHKYRPGSYYIQAIQGDEKVTVKVEKISP